MCDGSTKESAQSHVFLTVLMKWDGFMHRPVTAFHHHIVNINETYSSCYDAMVEYLWKHNLQRRRKATYVEQRISDEKSSLPLPSWQL